MQSDEDSAGDGALQAPARALTEGADGVVEAIPAPGSLADFSRRVRACETTRMLEMLHSMMRRTVPVGQRADYIALLNQRDEEISREESGAAWWE